MIKRIITALVLLPIVIGFFFFVPPFPYLELFMVCMVGLCAWEWSGFCYNQIAWRASYSFIAMGLFILLLGPLLSQLLIMVASIMWIFALFRVLSHNKNPQTSLRLLVTGLILICAGGVAIMALKSISDLALLLVLLWVWLADTLALFVGKQFGKNKLIPEVSPNKTWEGLFGALLGASAFSFAVSMYFALPVYQVISVGLLVTLVSVVGDLLMSCYKRQTGLDDTGSILPGHGGLLDRVDGLLAAAPIAWILISLTAIADI